MENNPIKEESGPSAGIEGAVEAIGKSIEISFTENPRTALYVVKPDAFHSRDWIATRAKDSGLHIVRRKSLILPNDFVAGEMYEKDSLPKPIEEATLEHFRSGPSEIVWVEGDDVAKKLLEFIGLKTNPALCNPESIRFILGEHEPKELEEGLKYFYNAAHRPMNDEERVEDLKKFNQFS